MAGRAGSGSAALLERSGRSPASRGSAVFLAHVMCVTLIIVFMCAGAAAGNGSRVTGLDDLYRPQVLPSEVDAHRPGLQDLLDVYHPGVLRLEPGLEDLCSQHLASFLTHLANSTSWAERMWDSSGRYSSKLMWGNNFWLGSLTQCEDLNNVEQELPFKVHFFVASLLLNVSVAIPQTGAEFDGQTSRGDSLGKIKWFMAAVAAVLVIVATLLDLVLRRRNNMAATSSPSIGAAQTGDAECNGNNLSYTSTGPEAETTKESKTEDKQKQVGDAECNDNNLSYTSTGPEAETTKESKTEDKQKQVGRATQLLLCFSALSNLLKICDTSSNEPLACLHGLRVFSLVWVIAGHSCMFAFPFSDNKEFRRLVERDFLFQSISSGAFSVDTFFFISGILVAYVFRKAGVRTAAGSLWAVARSQAMHFAGVFSYRYCRLILPYVFVLLVNQLTTTWFHHNSVFDTPTLDHYSCEHYWWRNLLFVNTLFPVKDMCMIWSWYLANDMQFYTLAIILLLISSRYLKFSASCLFVLLVSSWFTTGFIALYSQHVPREVCYSIEEPLGLFDQLYDKPWTRLGPYAVGMITGWLLHSIDCKLRMHKVAVVAGWAMSIGTTFVLVHGLYGDLGPLASAAYVSLGHTAWACALAWIVITCCTGNGGYVNKFLSAKLWCPLSRLTYCAYLVHPIIMLTAIMHNDSPIHLTRDTMVMTIFGYLVSSYALSLLVSLALEAPSIALLNALHPIRRLAK